MSHDVFISYSSKDKNAADAACAVLERNGIRCWIAPRDVLPGVNWGSAIVAAIHEVKLFVLVFSGSANTSPQIEREVERAISTGIPVIPFRIEDVKPSESLEYFISASHWLDAFTQPMEQSLETLAKVARNLIDIKQYAGATPAGAPAARAPSAAAIAPPAAGFASAAAPKRAGASPWLFVGGGAALAVGAVLVALFLVWPKKPAIQVSAAPAATIAPAVAPPPASQTPPVRPLAAQPAAVQPAPAQPPVVQATVPPAVVAPAAAAPPAAQSATVQPPAAQPAATQPAAVQPVSLTGRWSWNANCSGALWRGKFDLAATARDRFNGSFAGTEWHDIGSITDGQVDGTNVSFTRTTTALVQHWRGQIAEGRMEGSLSSDTYVCTWQARRD